MSYGVTTDLVTMTCGSCGVTFAMPEKLYDEARRHKGKQWYCPNGHSRIFTKTVEDELREAKEALAAERAYTDQVRADRDAIERSLTATKGVVTRMKNRVGNGVCPCCNRSFQNLRRHMNTKHPDFKDRDNVTAEA